MSDTSQARDYDAIYRELADVLTIVACADAATAAQAARRLPALARQLLDVAADDFRPKHLGQPAPAVRMWEVRFWLEGYSGRYDDPRLSCRVAAIDGLEAVNLVRAHYGSRLDLDEVEMVRT